MKKKKNKSCFGYFYFIDLEVFPGRNLKLPHQLKDDCKSMLQQ